MKTADATKPKDTMRPEYDMRGGVRGKYTERLKGDVLRGSLDPDVSQAFPDSASVNEALRLLLKVANKASRVTPPAA